MRVKPGPKLATDSLLHASAHRMPGSLRATAAEHLEALAVQHFSPTTLKSRASALLRLCRWCEERGLLRPHEVTRALLERYQRYLFHFRRPSGKALSAATQAQCLVAVKQYFRWLCKQSLLPANPASELELPRIGVRLPTECLTVSQVEALLSKPQLSTPAGLRDRAMLEVMWACGLRRSEVVALTPFDVRAEPGVVVVKQGKGRRDRVVPIGQRALAWVQRYLDEVRPSLVVPPDVGLLFLSAHGEAMNGDFLSRLMRQYLRSARIQVRGGCHLLRHACATHLLEGGADVRYVQELLGHSSLETTQVYTRVTVTRLKAVYEAAHPAARAAEKKNGLTQESLPTAAELLAELDAHAEVEHDGDNGAG